jgi:hypothetical protein
VLHHRPAVGSRRGESPPQDAKPEGENMRGRCVWLYVVASACRFGGVPWVCWRSPRGASRAPSKHHRHPCLQWVNQFDFLSESARADHRHSASRHAPSLPTLRGYDVSTARHWLRGGRYRISTNPRTDGVQPLLLRLRRARQFHGWSLISRVLPNFCWARFFSSNSSTLWLLWVMNEPLCA